MTDPVLAQRARMASLASLGQRVGYALFGLALGAFFVGLVTGFGSWTVWLVIAALGVGSLVLAPAIVLGYAVKAAAREDRERASGGTG